MTAEETKRKELPVKSVKDRILLTKQSSSLRAMSGLKLAWEVEAISTLLLYLFPKTAALNVRRGHLKRNRKKVPS